MRFSWSEIKSEMMCMIAQHYAEPLQHAGFVSYKNEGFHWYKIKGELLLTVRMPIFSPGQPIKLNLGFGAIPLFTWEHVAPTGAYRDFDWDFLTGFDHYAGVEMTITHSIASTVLGALPRESYSTPGIIYHLPSGLMIQHLNTDRCGAEALDELIFPVLDTFNSVEDVYRWNKAFKLKMFGCQTEEALIRTLEEKYLSADQPVPCLTPAFADECIHCRDEQWYPIILQYLSQYQKKRRTSPASPKTKQEAIEWADEDLHVQVLIDTLVHNDREMFSREKQRVRANMLRQLEKKLPHSMEGTGTVNGNVNGDGSC